MENYFNYFTEIEEHFQRQRGGALLLSTFDWALIETWKDAGIPLQAVLKGIEAAFENHGKRPSLRKVNGLAYCAQAVLTAAEEMKEAAIGAATEEAATKPEAFQSDEIVAFLRRCAEQLSLTKLPDRAGISCGAVAQESTLALREQADALKSTKKLPRLEDLERLLTVLEEKLFTVLLAAAPDQEIVEIRAEADRAMAPYRRKMPSAQIEQLQKQYVHKRLLEKYRVPRLSLFYM